MVGLRELWIMTLAAYHHSQAFFVPMAVRSSRRSVCGGGGDPGLGGVGVRSAQGRWELTPPGQYAPRSWCPGAVVGYGPEGRAEAGGAASRIGGKGRARGGALSMGYLEEVSDELAEKVLRFEEADTGKTIECYAERFAVVDGKRYLVAFPKDLAVAIAFEEDGEVAPVPLADPMMDRVFPLAEACIKDLGPELELLRTPSSLTVRGLSDAEPWTTDDGEILEAFSNVDDDDDDTEEEDSTDGSDPESSVDVPIEEYEDEGQGDEGEHEGEDEDEDEEVEDVEGVEEVELLGEFVLDEEEFLLVRFVDPFLLLAKESDDGRYLLLENEEDEEISPLVEELMSEDG